MPEGVRGFGRLSWESDPPRAVDGPVPEVGHLSWNLRTIRISVDGGCPRKASVRVNSCVGKTRVELATLVSSPERTERYGVNAVAEGIDPRPAVKDRTRGKSLAQFVAQP